MIDVRDTYVKYSLFAMRQRCTKHRKKSDGGLIMHPSSAGVDRNESDDARPADVTGGESQCLKSTVRRRMAI